MTLTIAVPSPITTRKLANKNKTSMKNIQSVIVDEKNKNKIFLLILIKLPMRPLSTHLIPMLNQILKLKFEDETDQNLFCCS